MIRLRPKRRTPRQLSLAQLESRRVARRITKARTDKGLTMKALGVKAGLSRSCISKLENSSKDPLLSTVASVAKVLKVSVDYLLWGK